MGYDGRQSASFVFGSKKEAASASTTPLDLFTSQEELETLTRRWPSSRLVEIWNGIPGAKTVTKFTSRKVAAERIWKAIQNLGVIEPRAADEAPESATVEVSALQPEPAVVGAEATQDAVLAGGDEPASTEPLSATETQPAPLEAVDNATAQVADVARS